MRDKLTSGQKSHFTRLMNEFKTKSSQHLSEIGKIRKEIDDYRTELLEGTKKRTAIKSEIEETVNQLYKALGLIEQKKRDIISIHHEVFEHSEKEPSVAQEIRSTRKQIESIFFDIDSKKDRFQVLYDKIFGRTGDNSIKGLKDEIEERKAELIKLYQTQKKKADGLLIQIDDILAGATGVELAKAFEDQKNKFKIPNIFWCVLFIITMISMCYLAFVTVRDIKDIKSAFFSFLTRLPFYIPAVWLGIFSSKQQSQNKRLEQEYAHKEALAKSFEGYKRQINDMGDYDDVLEIQYSFIKTLITAIEKNPSVTLESKIHNDSPPIIGKVTSVANKKKKEAASMMSG